ncbi:Gmad2 immunoglobulin-like domain-containing protein [Gorillibacterium massiliense]|uniref:Gmad2 immunoglobulin-like domain-containing protein n=1 Tax=Gorillibacterium massiliense TaxID=1280390 RepID=UPI0006949454|nr:Gmad2 immunoglobulin-like domain-containing protein [Gorillibacterium massiliense]
MKRKIHLKSAAGAALLLGLSLVFGACGTATNASETPAPATASPAPSVSAAPSPAVTTLPTTVPAAPTAAPTATPESSKSPEKIETENKAFRITAPLPNSTVGKSFKVTGQAKVFEAAFSYSFEDGHNVLAKGNVMADKGAPEWGNFEFTVNFEHATNSTGLLVIYETSAKDGSPVNQLVIPVKFEKDLVVPLSQNEAGTN